MVGRDWYSRPLATFHFWTSIAGVALATGGLFGAGAAQAGTLVATNTAGLADAVRAGAGLQTMFQLETLGGAAAFAVAQAVFAFNVYRTSRAGPLVTVVGAPAMESRV
jgi:cbb3-type cytochrome oxidase subunit 1